MDNSVSNKGSFVSDLRPGDRVTGYFLVRQKQLEPFRDQIAVNVRQPRDVSARTGQAAREPWPSTWLRLYPRQRHDCLARLVPER